jgi:hypothetical protein
MLEVLVFRYGNLPQAAIIGLVFGAMLAGAATWAIFGRRPLYPLSPSWYVLRLGFGACLLAAGQMLWLFYVPALKLGIAFLLVLADFFGAFAYGVYIMHISKSRSRDSYGHDRNAWMAFVPFANLLLMCRPSQTTSIAPRSFSSATFGITLLVLSRIIFSYVETSSVDIAEKINADPKAKSVVQALSVRATGIEQALDTLIAAEPAPTRIDTDLELTAVTREGTHLIYEFRLDNANAQTLDPDYRGFVHGHFCSALMPYLEAGATVQLRYQRLDGTEFDTVDLSLAECTS